ncbi:PAS domain S-box protein [Brevibacillus sp. SYSU BS000544]|uniref:SpoIIE family protein phosphatase n=1 Tax=Brevibacillus sp. SYSU BS000544 TaxID=3416443 RepID=UPI003CE574FF
MSQENRTLSEELKKLSIIQKTFEQMDGNESLLGLLLTCSYEGCLVMDLDGIIQAVNPVCKRMTGLSANQLVGQAFYSRIHPEDIDATMFRFSMLKMDIPTRKAECRYLDARGFYIWMEAKGKLLKDHEGNSLGILVHFYNSTERKSIEDQYLLKEKVFENALEGIVITDPDGRILMVNPAFCSITGYSKEEVIGQNPRMLKSEIHDKAFFKSLWQSLKETGKWEGEIWNKRKNGEIFVEWATIRAIRSEKGKDMFYASVFTDITNRKQVEEKLHYDLQLAKQVQKSVLSSPVKNERVEIDALYIPSEELGGDMYAWYEIDEYRYGVIVLDVVGHGVAASLISMSIRSLLQGLITRLIDPVLVMKELNRHMRALYHSSDLIGDQFLTAIYVLVDTKQKMLSYANAGHPAGLLLKNDQTVLPLDQGGVPIGLFSDVPVMKYHIPLEGSSRIILLTDGLIDAISQNYEVALKHLQKEIMDHLNGSNEALLKKVISAFVTSNHQDDICLVSIKVESD